MTYQSKTLSVFEIIATVPKPAEMATAETDLIRVQADTQAKYEEYRAVLARVEATERGKIAGDSDAVRSELGAVQSTITDLERQQSALLLIIAKHRPAYAAALFKALLPMRQNMAERVVTAIDSLKTATETLRETYDVLSAAGVSPTRLPLPIYCDPIRKLAEKIATEESA